MDTEVPSRPLRMEAESPIRPQELSGDEVLVIDPAPSDLKIPWIQGRNINIANNAEGNAHINLQESLANLAETILKDYEYEFVINVPKERPNGNTMKVVFPFESSPTTVTIPYGLVQGTITWKKIYSYHCENTPRQYFIQYEDNHHKVAMKLLLCDGHPLFRFDDWKKLVNDHTSQYYLSPHLIGKLAARMAHIQISLSCLRMSSD